MSLYPAYLQLVNQVGGEPLVRHNCDGGVQFDCREEVSKETARLIELAIEEGKRRRSAEIAQLLGVLK